MASSQISAAAQLNGELHNQLNRENLTYKVQKVWRGEDVKHPQKVEENVMKPFSQQGLGEIGSNCKGALVYEFAIQKRAPQFWVFAWHSPSPAENKHKVFTKLYYSMDAINWDTIEHMLNNSGNRSECVEGDIKVEAAIPAETVIPFPGTCYAKIQRLI